MKANYDHMPKAIEAVGNGSHLINYNIEPVEQEGKTSYNCNQVVVWSLAKDEIKRALINEEFPHDIEQKLINDFNAANAGILPETAKQPYFDFLQKRKELKAMVDEMQL